MKRVNKATCAYWTANTFTYLLVGLYESMVSYSIGPYTVSYTVSGVDASLLILEQGSATRGSGAACGSCTAPRDLGK